MNLFKKIFASIYLTAACSILTYSMVQDSLPPAAPENVRGFGYEKHYDITWFNNSEEDLAGYKVYRKTGSEFILYANVPKEKSYLTLNVGQIGVTNTFKVSAYDINGNESSLSDSVVVTTHEMTDEEFLDMVQRATFRFFWDYAHPVSGLTRERFGSGNTVTSGGSGFGVMALLVGIEREFIKREQGVERMLKILTFLNEKADRFHGAFSHWLDGNTGKVIPFSQYDNGGDIVETSFMIQGLLAARQYFDGSDSLETEIRNLITQIWESVEWDWYRRSPYSDHLYWHWSPNYGWQMNMKLIGYMETMITYLLAIASPSHGVPASTFHNGWAGSGYVNNNTYYGYKLWVGPSYGGPLFFAHYSFLGFDPRNKADKYCNYFMNNRHHTLINREYCIANPRGHVGYSENNWGLTASDDPWGYSEHRPYGNDNGTITPTAALSSMPYTPEESIAALKNFYRSYFGNLWGEYGFKDAFNLSSNWFANSYIAIDQGPIIVMIENYRSDLLWEMFMANPEIQPMLDSIGFKADSTTDIGDNFPAQLEYKLFGNYPNPFNPYTTISFSIPQNEIVEINIYNSLGEKIRELVRKEFDAGENHISWNGKDDNDTTVNSGVYLYRISVGTVEKNENKFLTGKMVLLK
jgi:hypothetical protein